MEIQAHLEINPEQIKTNFREVFTAIEKNSHSAYHIVCNLAHQDSGDYFISLEIGKDDNAQYLMPLVFQDIMRDLMANARKYTPPGGRIAAGLYVSTEELTFVVEDSGKGIPSEELEKVFLYGYRASNAQDRPTRGGGFGLTKAYYICKALGGKMYIDSPISENKGTRIKLTLPIP